VCVAANLLTQPEREAVIREAPENDAGDSLPAYTTGLKAHARSVDRRFEE
jgi:hypothetical protein